VRKEKEKEAKRKEKQTGNSNYNKGIEDKCVYNKNSPAVSCTAGLSAVLCFVFVGFPLLTFLF
jgi:hypothetical protein